MVLNHQSLGKFYEVLMISWILGYTILNGTKTKCGFGNISWKSPRSNGFGKRNLIFPWTLAAQKRESFPGPWTQIWECPSEVREIRWKCIEMHWKSTENVNMWCLKALEMWKCFCVTVLLSPSFRIRAELCQTVRSMRKRVWGSGSEGSRYAAS
jgi:hypothetical protein